MKSLYPVCIGAGILVSAWLAAAPAPAQEISHAIAIHGGAGTLSRETLTPEREREFRGALTQALRTGDSILALGGSALDAVVAAIVLLEDCPLFNAGRGAVFTDAGTNELDASIMEGESLNAGAVAAVRHVKNPILLARAVMEHSPHVLLMGDGAESFAREQGIELVDSTYFFTEHRWNQLQKKKAAAKGDREGGTVGAVALDRHGNLAAGTSTGGLTNKRWGRVGDSPVIGAGTYADNRTCAVSATGDGEYFIRAAVAHDISALMGYSRLPAQDAADRVIHQKLTAMGGTGGVIVMDRQGNVAFSFNTTGMYRGYCRAQGQPVVSIFAD